jgi:hypothetical protein
LAAQQEQETEQAPLLEEEVDWGASPGGEEPSDDEAAGEETAGGEEALATPEAFLRAITLAGQRLRPLWLK